MRTTKRKNEKMWRKIVAKVRKGSKGGKRGEWSARKAQLAVKLYIKAGGKYIGKKSKKNGLAKWTREKWRTKSGKNSILGPKATRERYLPSNIIKKLTSREYELTSAAKKRSRKQYSKQPVAIAKKIAKLKYRKFKYLL